MASSDQTTPDPSSSTRRRRIAGTVLVAVLAAALIAVVVERSGGDKVINAGGKTKILVGASSGDGMDAAGEGKLADVGGCLGWAPTTSSATGTVVIWPHGTNVDQPDPLRVKIKGKTYGIGDTVRVGGGEIGPLEPSSYFYDQVPKACRTANVWLANTD